MQLQGKSQDNLGELGRAAEICGDLWAAVESLQHAVEIVGVSSASHEIKRKCMECHGYLMYQRPILGDCTIFWPVFVWLFAGVNLCMRHTINILKSYFPTRRSMTNDVKVIKVFQIVLVVVAVVVVVDTTIPFAAWG